MSTLAVGLLVNILVTFVFPKNQGHKIIALIAPILTGLKHRRHLILIRKVQLLLILAFLDGIKRIRLNRRQRLCLKRPILAFILLFHKLFRLIVSWSWRLEFAQLCV